MDANVENSFLLTSLDAAKSAETALIDFTALSNFSCIEFN